MIIWEIIFLWIITLIAFGAFLQVGISDMRYSFGDECVLAFCRLGVAGLAPRAPGTWGTAFACALAPFIFLPLGIVWRGVVLVVLFVLGALAGGHAEKLLGKNDPGQVVIDELVGVWLVLLPWSNPGFWMIVSAFVLFRIFDIVKPWPVKASENWLPGGFGMMIDDVLAGVLALACLFLLRQSGILCGI